MRWIARCAASLALSAALVLAGFCAGAGQGARAGHDVQQAYAVGEVQAARAFATILGSMGFSVGAYAVKNSLSFDDAADNLYVDFNNAMSADPVHSLVTSAVSALVASPTGVVFASLGLTVDALKGIAQWMLDDGLLDASSVSYPDVVYSPANLSFSVSDAPFSVSDYPSYGGMSSWNGDVGYSFFSSFEIVSASYSKWSSDIPYILVFTLRSPSDSPSSYSAGLYASESNRLATSGGGLPGGDTFELHYFPTTVSLPTYAFPTSLSSMPSSFARYLDSSYESTGVGVTTPTDIAVSGAPANIGSSSTAADAQAFADAVSANLADKTLVANGTTVNNYSYGDIVTDGTVTPPADNILDWLQENLGALQGTLEGVLEGIQAGTIEIVDAVTAAPATVIEGVQTFFSPVVQLFTPSDLSDDDIGQMISSNASGSHTFAQHFPFCVLNDYMSAFNSLAVGQQSRAAINYTPLHFVITIPAAGYSGGKPVKMDFTHYFTDEFYGFTLGRFSQLVLSVCTFIAILSFVARLVGIADLPSNFYLNQDGDSVAVYEDSDGQTRLF